MNAADELSGIARITDGNEQEARQMRANLAIFARQTGDPQVRRMVSEVLAGKRNVRDVLRSRVFTDIVGARIERIEQGLAQLTDEERTLVFDPDRPRATEATLESLRDRSLSLEELRAAADANL